MEKAINEALLVQCLFVKWGYPFILNVINSGGTLMYWAGEKISTDIVESMGWQQVDDTASQTTFLDVKNFPSTRIVICKK